MTDDFRTRLERELEVLEGPPGDLVHNSLQQGRRLRRTRRGCQAGAALVAALALLGVVLNLPPDRNFSMPAAALPVPTPTETQARATPEGLLAAVLEALPGGETSHYAGNGAVSTAEEESPLMVQTYLDDGRGPGLIRLSVSREDPAARVPGSRPRRSTTLPDGDKLTVTRLPGNCLQQLVVTRERTDHVMVEVSVANCLAGNGTESPEGRMALTQQQAIDLAGDDRLGLLIPKRLVEEGAQRFADLPGIE